MFLKLNQLLTDKLATFNEEKYLSFCESKFQDYKAIAVYLPYLPETTYATFYTNLFETNKDALEVFKSLKTTFENANSISEIIQCAYTLENTKIMENKLYANEMLLVRCYLFYEIHNPAFFATISNLKSMSDFTTDTFKNYISKTIGYSKQEIATEFRIDKKTLTKWLILVYGYDKFKDRKKINFLEYLEIFNAFFLTEEEEKLDLNANLESVMTRLVKGATYSKSEIIELGLHTKEDISRASYNIAHKALQRKYNYFKTYDKYPVSIANKMIEDLKNGAI